MQENRSFDHYFGTYRRADGIPVSRGTELGFPVFPISLWSAHCTKNVPSSCSNALENPGSSNYAWTDLTYLLYKHHVSWRYYIFKGTEPDCESDTSLRRSPRTQGPTTPSFWNPLRAFETVRNNHQEGKHPIA